MKLLLVSDFKLTKPEELRLRQWCKQFGVVWNSFSIISVADEPRHQGKLLDTKILLRENKDRVLQQIRRHEDRRAVLTLGPMAFQIVTGKSSLTPWVGGPMHDTGVAPVVIPSFTIMKCLRQPEYLPVVKWYFYRAFLFSVGKLEKWRWPRMVYTGPYEQTLMDLLHVPAISLDIENNPKTNKIRCIGVGTSDIAVAVPIPPEGDATERDLAALRKLLMSPVLKILQNGQHDRSELREIGWHVEGPFYDTMLAHTIVAPKLPHGLAFLSSTETHAPCWKSEFHESDEKEEGRGEWFAKAPLSELLPYNCKDNIQQFNIYNSLNAKLDKTHNGHELFGQLTRLDEIAYKMRLRGMQVNMENLEAHKKAMCAEIEKINADFRILVPDEEVKLGKTGSGPSLPKYFFDTVGAPPVSYSPVTGKPTLDKGALEYYVGFFTEQKAANLAQLCRMILRYRQITKLMSSYILTLPIGLDGSVHPHWRACKARTGRWAANNPALQTIPKPRKKKDGSIVPGLRDIFCAHDGFKLVKADYKTLELFIIAALSGDPDMLHAKETGQDLHQMTADAAFGRKATKQERNIAKTVNYALAYGSGDELIWKRLIIEIPTITIDMVAHIRKTFFKLFNHVQVWQEQLISDAKMNCYVEAPFSGRRQHYHDGKISPTQVKNYPIQATAGDLVNRAVETVAGTIDWKSTYLLGQIHDELLIETTDADFGVALLREHMQAPITINGITTTFAVDVSVGDNWGHCIEVK